MCPPQTHSTVWGVCVCPQHPPQSSECLHGAVPLPHPCLHPIPVAPLWARGLPGTAGMGAGRGLVLSLGGHPMPGCRHRPCWERASRLGARPPTTAGSKPGRRQGRESSGSMPGAPGEQLVLVCMPRWWGWSGSAGRGPHPQGLQRRGLGCIMQCHDAPSAGTPTQGIARAACSQRWREPGGRWIWTRCVGTRQPLGTAATPLPLAPPGTAKEGAEVRALAAAAPETPA